MRGLETPRLLLEPQTAAHSEAMFELLGDPVLYRFENAPPASLQALRARFEKLETRRSGDGREQWLNWVLRPRSGGLIGYVQATVRGDGQAFVAYVIGSAHWGQGLAGEAVTAMLGELATQYGVHTAWAVFKRANTRSRRLLERLGFVAADAADLLRLAVDGDEDLMQRRIAATVPAR
jgi:[ribosomal protein S5]-alanine N-acetyltransferase